MSKNKLLTPTEYGYAFQAAALSNLEGQLLTLIESLGLREGQEKATKDILRNTLWRWHSDMGVSIPAKMLYSLIREQYERKYGKQETPPKAKSV